MVLVPVTAVRVAIVLMMLIVFTVLMVLMVLVALMVLVVLMVPIMLMVMMVLVVLVMLKVRTRMSIVAAGPMCVRSGTEEAKLYNFKSLHFTYVQFNLYGFRSGRFSRSQQMMFCVAFFLCGFHGAMNDPGFIDLGGFPGAGSAQSGFRSVWLSHSKWSSVPRESDRGGHLLQK